MFGWTSVTAAESSGTPGIPVARRNGTALRSKDISSAIYKAERKSGLSSDVRQGIFESTLRTQAVVRYLDEEQEQEDGEGIDEDEDPEEVEDPEVYICFDGDTAGQEAATRIQEKLQKNRIHCKILVPVEKDWNEDLLYRREEKLCQGKA